MKCFTFVAIVALLSCTVLGADEQKGVAQVGTDSAQAKTQADAGEIDNTKPTSYWMEKKLDYSQAVLRGLASSDFESIRKNALQLQLLNKVEGFIRRRNADYRHHVQTFERITGELARQAERKNIEGVTLAFNQLTISCVHCHESLRSEQLKESGDEQ
ncbi:MAG: hypothetical protein R3C05_15215 [Pirellulaceae bacterium]